MAIVDPYPVGLYIEVWIATILSNIWFWLGYKLIVERKKKEEKK